MMLGRSTKTIGVLFLGACAAFAQDAGSAPKGQGAFGSGTPFSATTQAPDEPGLFQLPRAPLPNAALLSAASGRERRAADLRKFDEPQVFSNIMSKYVVQVERLPVFRTRDLYSRKGLVALSFREHPGLYAGNFFNSNTGEAYEMFLEDERQENMHDFQDIAHAMAVGGDRAESDAILTEERDAYLRDEHSDPLQALEDAPKTRDGTPLILNLEQLQVTWLKITF